MVGVRIILVLKEIKPHVKNIGMSEYVIAKRKPNRIHVYHFVGPTNSLARDMLKFLAPFQNNKEETGISVFLQQLSTKNCNSALVFVR